MYQRSYTQVRTAVGTTEKFEVTVGVHQGSELSPFLFAMVMDCLTKDVRSEAPWTMMFADDVVICAERQEEVEERLERWRRALEDRGMRISRKKTEYLCVGGREDEEEGELKMQGEKVPRVTEFRYLGSTVQADGDSEIEVAKRIAAGWNSWRKVSGVLCVPKGAPERERQAAQGDGQAGNVVQYEDSGGDAEDGEEFGSFKNENAEI